MMNYNYLDPEEILNSKDFKPVYIYLKIFNNLQIGWHYIIDLIYIYTQVKNLNKPLKILDAGGGDGPLQYLLLEMGFDVYNIDLYQQKTSSILNKRYKIETSSLPSFFKTKYYNHLESIDSTGKSNFVHNSKIKIKIILYKIWRKIFKYGNTQPGTLYKISGNLLNLPEISNNFFDVILSISVIEHIDINENRKLLYELNRILKKDGKLYITTSATIEKQSWFHEPSKGWCFSQQDLRDIFKAKPLYWQDEKAILEKYEKNIFLKDNLAKFHFSNGNCGMPNGIYKPKYFPVVISN